MAALAVAQAGLELLEQLFLALVETHRRLHLDVHPQVALGAAADGAHALAAQPEDLAALGALRDFQLQRGLLAESGHADLAAQGRSRVADRDLAGEVRALALENRVRPHQDFDVEITGGTAIAPRLALSAQPDTVAAVHPRRDLDRQGLGLAHAPLAVTLVAGIIDHGALPLALGTGLLDRKETLLHAYGAATAATAAGDGLRAGLGAAAGAHRALDRQRKADGHFVAEHGLFEFEFEFVAQVGPAEQPRPPSAATAAEDVAEDFAADIAERITRPEAA